MKVLVACEFSGRVREAFRKFGHDAWSCDLLPSDDKSKHHITGDVEQILNDGWDLMLAFPPCTYLCSSGLHWNKRVEGREKKTEEALEFVRLLLNAPVNKIAVENPVGRIGTAIRKADQSIHPYMFGDDASKRTCLWLKNLPLLKPTDYIEPRMINGKARWSNQTDSGQNKLPPSKDRWKKRSETYQGIADAMALQWGEDATTES
tara:strand:+ start:381 stop:995 length:615 start_codon:yes stop_codon:yes gene_type:complete